MEKTKADLRITITKGLIAMKKAGLLGLIYIDAEVIRVEVKDAYGVFQSTPITWEMAERLVAKFRYESSLTAKERKNGTTR